MQRLWANECSVSWGRGYPLCLLISERFKPCKPQSGWRLVLRIRTLLGQGSVSADASACRGRAGVIAPHACSPAQCSLAKARCDNGKSRGVDEPVPALVVAALGPRNMSSDCSLHLQVAQLEARKKGAVEREDYDMAKVLKQEIDVLRAAGETAAALEPARPQ